MAFTQDKNIKIWMNSNFSANYPEEKVPEQGEQVFVEGVFGVMEQYWRDGGDRKKYMGFQEAGNYLRRKRVNNTHQDGTNSNQVKYVGVASPNLRSTATGVPVNYIVFRNATKTVQIDLNDQRNNISGNSHKVYESPTRADFKKPASFTYSNNSNKPITTTTNPNSRPLSTLNDSPHPIPPPRHAINQLSNLQSPNPLQSPLP